MTVLNAFYFIFFGSVSFYFGLAFNWLCSENILPNTVNAY